MTTSFALPDLGEGLTESDIVAWHVQVGDTVEMNQSIAEIETAKAIVDLPSPHAGRIAALHADEGDTVQVGAPLITFELAGENAEPESRPAPEPPDVSDEESATDTLQPNLVGYGAASSTSDRPRRRARKARPAPVRVPDPPGAEGKTRATPLVRTLAKKRGLDLASIHGSGPNGRVTRQDVEDARGSRLSESVGERRVPIRGVRKAMAEAMSRSVSEAPQATMQLTIDVTRSCALVSRLRADRGDEAPKVSILTLCAKAVCLALRDAPALNSTWDGDAGEIIEHDHVDLGIAAATDRGLLVPVIATADRQDLAGLADAIAELTRQAREGTTAPAALAGGTFTITNVGVFGVDAGSPILNPGESGILAIGAVRRRPWEHEGELALRDVVTLSLTFDHRIADGEQAARFLTAVGALLEDPARAMTRV
ncbi:dihydrolipoamide acetyltransferase family protein [Microbacterium sp. G2-8]|uniref:dihydrolipoamide acetyltransferase family protein n=1 Tax=Microbacterium sp. G2-8 TaxID=2842454 RepID=UPI001C8A3951|nr:dihydrolipoamide acetyltransferase family protein [Microbacterium sp. G2-8]